MAVVFITGGSSGIGLATVRRLAAAGDQVFCGSRNPTSAVLGAELHGTGVFVTVVAPGLFRTAMSEQLPSCQVADGSGYARAFETLRSRNVLGLFHRN